MTSSRPSPVPPWTDIALVLLAVGVVTLGPTGAAAALPAAPPDVGDAVDGAENTTDDAPSTVDETTADVTEPLDSTADTVESDAESAVNATAETTASTAETLDAAADGTTGLSSGDLSVVAQPSLDADAVLSSTSDTGAGGEAASASHAGRADGAAERAGSASRTAPDAGAAGSGVDDPTPPLSAGAVALGGLLGGSVAARRALAVAESSHGSGIVGTTRRAVAAHAGTPWRDRCWRVAGAFGYQRYDDSDPLEHDARAAIYQYIEETGGAYLSEISRETAIPLSTARYHLKILDHERVVTTVKMRGKRLYFPAGTEPSELQAALKNDGSAAVLRTLARHGADSVSGLAATLGRDVSTVSHHLQHLADAGFVRRKRDGQAVVNRLAPAVRGVLVSHADGAEPTSAPAHGRGELSD